MVKDMKSKFEGLGLEAIDFQRGGLLHAELTMFIARLRGVGNDQQRSIILGEMSKVIMKRTGLAIAWGWLSEGLDIQIYVPPVTRTHPLLYKAQQKALMDESREDYRPISIEKDLNGTVDLKNSKVGGDFSTLVSVINLPETIWKSNLLTDGEWSAQLLHELGHPFAYFEFLGQTCVTNMILNEVSRVWMGNYPVEKRIKVLTAAEAQYQQKFVDKEEVAKNDDPHVAHALIVNSSIVKIRSEIGTEFYDQRVFETLADQFCARHGGARDWVTGVDKSQRDAGWITRNVAFRSTTSMIVANLIKFTMLATVNAPTAMAVRAATGKAIISKSLISGGSLAFGQGFNLAIASLLSLVNNQRLRYDEIPVRYANFRRELVGDLKNRNLPVDYVKRVLSDLEVIDEAIGNLNKLGNLDTMLYNWIIDGVIGRRKENRLQQQYEKLANNELFTRAAQLSTVGNV